MHHMPEKKMVVGNDSAPAEFICPLTLAVFNSPVVLSDGKTYEEGHTGMASAALDESDDP